MFPFSLVHKKEFVCPWESFDGYAEHRSRPIDGNARGGLDVQSMNSGNGGVVSVTISDPLMPLSLDPGQTPKTVPTVKFVSTMELPSRGSNATE